MSLALDHNISQYVNRCWGLFGAWGTISPPERMNRLLNAVNDIFRTLQIPTLNASMGRSLGGSNAELDFVTWTVNMEPQLISNPGVNRKALGELAISMYHESRHAEQWYRVAQAVAAGICVPGGVVATNTRYGVTSSQIAAALFIPDRIALDAEQKKRFFPQAMRQDTIGWFNSIYGTNAAQRNNVLGNIGGNFAAYRQLPEEADAHPVEQKVRREWKSRVSTLESNDALSGVAGLFNRP